jgi:hypothetical protein
VLEIKKLDSGSRAALVITLSEIGLFQLVDSYNYLELRSIEEIEDSNKLGLISKSSLHTVITCLAILSSLGEYEENKKRIKILENITIDMYSQVRQKLNSDSGESPQVIAKSCLELARKTSNSVFSMAISYLETLYF